MKELRSVFLGCRSTHIRSISRRRASQQQRTIRTQSPFFAISEEVQQAIAEHQPVVALESTIYTHGFPYPENLALASRLESLVRTNGGVPATIGIVDGVARVGMGADQLICLITSTGSKDTLKVSRRDLGFVCGLKDSNGKRMNGGTTVSATMVLAHLAGIRVFATGGLGGVHRGAEQSMDVSADLTELGRTPVAVISSGCKSFLDIPKTLEYLETQGAAVATFADGRTGSINFPAFYTRESGVKSPMVVQNEMEAASVIHAHLSLGLKSGLLLANPIPEQHSIPLQKMEAAISQALEAADVAGATGAASTPYVLQRIKEITGERSMQANEALAEANVVRGTKVAVALVRMENDEPRRNRFAQDVTSISDNQAHPNSSGGHQTISSTIVSAASNDAETYNSNHTSVPTNFPSLASNSVSNKNSPVVSDQKADIFVAGSLAVDLACDYSPLSGSTSRTPGQQTSNPAKITDSLGGVGYNVARAAHLMGATVRLCSAVGDDLAGKGALEALVASGLSDTAIKTFNKDSGSRTAQYVAINNINKDLHLAMADMTILEPTGEGSAVSETLESFWLPQLQYSRPSHLVVDANWPPQHLAGWLQAGNSVGAHITFEPVSNNKSARIFHLPKPDALSVFPSASIHLVTPNIHELSSMYHAAKESGALDHADWWKVIDAFGIPSSGARVQLALATSSDLVDQGIPQQSLQLLPYVPTICTKLGSRGVLVTKLLGAKDVRLTSGEYAPHILSRCTNGTEDTLGVGGVYMRLFPAIEEVKAEEIVSVNGVGDTFAGTLVAGLAARGKDARVEELIDLAQRAAVLTLRSNESVSTGLGTLRILL